MNEFDLGPKGYQRLTLSDERVLTAHRIGKYITVTMHHANGQIEWQKGYRALDEAIAEWNMWKDG